MIFSADVVSQKGYPYGLAILDNGVFRYPFEKQSMLSVYYKFSKWLNGGVDVLPMLWMDFNHTKVFDYNSSFICTNPEIYHPSSK